MVELRGRRAAGAGGEGDQADEDLRRGFEAFAGEEVPVFAIGAGVGVDALGVAGELEPDAGLSCVFSLIDGVERMILAADEADAGLFAGLAVQHGELLAAVLEILADGDAGHRAGDVVVGAGEDAGDAGDDLAVAVERLDDEMCRRRVRSR